MVTQVQGQQPRIIHFEQFVGAASAPLQPRYRPRQPEKTILYRAVDPGEDLLVAGPASFTRFAPVAATPQLLVSD